MAPAAMRQWLSSWSLGGSNIMRIWQQKIEKRPALILGYACMVSSAFAGFIFVVMLIGLCVEGVHEHFSAALWFVLLLFAFFAFTSFYVARNLWRESFSGSSQSIMAELQIHDFRSVEFYDIATRYFRHRLFVIQGCGLFFIIMAALSVVIVFISDVPWWFDIFLGVSSLFCTAIGWTSYRIGKTGIRMIDSAHMAGTEHQLQALRQLATGSFRGDPVGGFILGYFRDDKHTT
jgi:hypothetical protein